MRMAQKSNTRWKLLSAGLVIALLVAATGAATLAATAAESGSETPDMEATANESTQDHVQFQNPDFEDGLDEWNSTNFEVGSNDTVSSVVTEEGEVAAINQTITTSGEANMSVRMRWNVSTDDGVGIIVNGQTRLLASQSNEWMIFRTTLDKGENNVGFAHAGVNETESNQTGLVLDYVRITDVNSSDTDEGNATEPDSGDGSEEEETPDTGDGDNNETDSGNGNESDAGTGDETDGSQGDTSPPDDGIGEPNEGDNGDEGDSTDEDNGDSSDDDESTGSDDEVTPPEDGEENSTDDEVTPPEDGEENSTDDEVTPPEDGEENSTDENSSGTGDPVDDPPQSGNETDEEEVSNNPDTNESEQLLDNEQNESSPTVTEEDGPGFGVIVALMALLATALVALRRR